MVGLVIVSHSGALADGVVALAREMGGDDVAIEAAGGMDDGAIGTDAARVMLAIEAARGADGVLVLMDLGSALMSAELATEMVDPDGGPVMLCGAPLVEGAVAAAARARGGGTLAEVAEEARGALRMKAEQLGEEDVPAAPTALAPASAAGGGAELRLVVANRLGLHARPAARLVGAASGFDADVSVENASRARGPASARSLTAVATLTVRQGDEIVVRASGPQADAALAAIEALAADRFGDPPDEDVPAVVEAPAGAPTSPPARLGPGSRLTGVPAAAGIAIGPALLLDRPALRADDRPAGTPAEEGARLEAARTLARADLADARASVAARAGEDEAAIFDAHALLLDDAALLDPARRGIEAGGLSAGEAWLGAARDAADAYRGLEDPYLRERAVDVEDVAARVLRHLDGSDSAGGLAAEGIVVCGELTPGQAAGLDPSRVAGIATAHGGATSHAAILSRALGLPAVVGLGDGLLTLAAGTTLVLDGDAGTVEVDPGPEVVAERERRRAQADAVRSEQRVRAAEPARTRDGGRIEVFANLGSPREAAGAVELGAEGVGLLRTEFLFLDRGEPPSEAEQEAVYREVAEALEGRPLVLRTLDAGADKPLPFLCQAPEENPFLGLRGIRLSLREPVLFRAQLRAALRVAADHPVKVMFPMVSTLAELRTARSWLGEEAAALGGRPAGLEVGVMVEVPAVALAAERFAREADFFSVGTNDLSQYTMAAERGNEHVADLLGGPLPPVLRLIRAVVEGAEAHGRWVGVCGELAGEPAAAVLLAGLGVTELSMAASRIGAVKHVLRTTDLAAARAAASRALDAEGAQEAAALAAGASDAL